MSSLLEVEVLAHVQKRHITCQAYVQKVHHQKWIVYWGWAVTLMDSEPPHKDMLLQISEWKCHLT